MVFSFNLPNLIPIRYCRCGHDGTGMDINHINCPTCRKPMKKKGVKGS